MEVNFSWTRVLPTSLVINLATLGPLGSLKAPGTWGTLAGIGWYTMIFYNLDPLISFLIIIFSAYLAIGICGEAENRLQKRDPGEIVLDELVAVPVCFIGIEVFTYTHPWILIASGFALFRFFDILKPLGIKKLQNLPEGTGVVMDDIAAALATCICMHALLRFTEGIPLSSLRTCQWPQECKVYPGLLLSRSTMPACQNPLTHPTMHQSHWAILFLS